MFFTRPKTNDTVHAKSNRVGMDVTSTRIRATIGDRPVSLDSPDIDLAMTLSLEKSTIAVGRAGFQLVRKSPHVVATNYLMPGEKSWKHHRQHLTADGALGLTFDRLAKTLHGEADAIALALPAYLTTAQAKSVAHAAIMHKLPIVGSISMPLAIVSERAQSILTGESIAIDDDSEGRVDIVPIRPKNDGPGSAVVIDCDEYGLNATVVWVDRDAVRILNSMAWPKLSSKLWTDRLIDTIADRCVRQCRRDPRDSAEAEQSLFEQIHGKLNDSQAVSYSFQLRAAHWVQDLIVQQADLDLSCSPLISQAIAGLTDLIYASGVPAPPRVIWLTHAASRLPGLQSAIYEHSAESTDVERLNENAVAASVAKLAPRWQANELPRQHLDVAFPVKLSFPALESVKSQIS